MESLNKMLERYMQSERRIKHYDIEVSVALDDKMPTVYPAPLDNRSYTLKFSRALGQLFMEQRDSLLTSQDIWAAERGERLNKNYKFQLRTEFDNGLQRIILEHNGRRIPEDAITEINDKLSDIADGKIKENPSWRGGNLIAALELQSEHGRIYLENLPETSLYSVRTRVEIPLKKLSS